MNFNSIPIDAGSILALQWADYEPLYADLEKHSLTANNIEKWLNDWSTLAATVDEQYWRLYIGTTVNTADKETEKRYNQFTQDIQPQAKIAEQKLKEKLLNSGLSPRSFSTALQRIQAEADIFAEKNLSLLAEEQNLVLEYNKITGAMTVQWNGEEKPISQMSAFLFEPNRSLRERVWRLTAERKSREWKAISDLWERFVPLRRRIAENAGMSDYRAYMWKQRFRFDYTPDDCKSFHAAIEEVVVPAAKQIYEKRRQQLGIESVRPWDLFVDPAGNKAPAPFETIEEFQAKTKVIFQKIDPKFGEYFQIMMDEGLLDLESRKNKAPGAYSLGLHVAHRPFVFMSAVKIPWDVQTLLHEGGHAFHEFERAHVNFYQRGEIYLPSEFAEVASMGMELLASPYLTKEHGGFYTEQDAARAMINQMQGVITFWPYMALVDAFQHWVYENPEQGSSMSSCDEKWAELWDRFMPGVDYSGLENEKRTYWYWQMHIHTHPFYYVEYGLAQLGAVQVFGNARKAEKKAVADYRKALALGATVPLPELFSAAGASFAFDATTLRNAITLMEDVIGEMESKLSA